MVEQAVHVLVLFQHGVVVALERQYFGFVPVADGDALDVAEEVRARFGIGLPADELDVEPHFAVGEFEGKRPVDFVPDLQSHEFAVYQRPVIFPDQCCQPADGNSVAVQPEQPDYVIGYIELFGSETRFPPAHLGGVQHQHQRWKIRGVRSKHGNRDFITYK